MRVNTLSGAHVEGTEGPQTLARQVAMHRRRRKDHRHADFVFALRLIRQNDVPSARAHSILSLCTNTRKTLLQSVCATLKSTVNRHQISVEIARELIPLRVAHERAVEHENFGLSRAFVQHVLEVPKTRLKAHNAEFAKAINRRVGNLREVLTEEVAQRAVFLGQNSRWRIIPHRRERFFAILCHWRENLL